MFSLQSIKLSELTRRIHQTINEAFADQLFWVVADVTSHSFKPRENRHYLILAEKQEGTNALVAKVETIAWQDGARQIAQFQKATGQRFTNDIRVLVRVSVDYTSAYGLRLTLHDIDPNFTIGDLERQKQAVLERLLTECADFIQKAGGRYITRNNQLALNPVIQRIAVITSSSSAGYEDFKHILHSNAYRYTFRTDPYFTAVQGEANAGAIRQKLLDVHQSGIPYDAVVIIRGGGAQTDFLVFDTFALGQVVAKFPIPVITGIGHQRNETIVDLMAHTPTNVPTKAAEFIIAHNRKFEEAVLDAQKMVLIKAQQLLTLHKDRITRANQVILNTTKNILFSRQKSLVEVSNHLLSWPGSLLSNKENDLKNALSNLSIYARNYFVHQNSHIEHCISLFRLMSPEALLKKGFALVYHKGKITGNPDNLSAGDEITVLLSDTELHSVITTKKKSNGTAFKL